MRRTGGVVVVTAAVVLAGCALSHFRPTSSNMPAAGVGSDDNDRIAWAADEPYVVVVRKSCRTLDVYRYGERMESFPAVFGLGGSGSKLFEGDRRTPTGLYTIVDKWPHPRWRYFFLLDYPNPDDVHRYWLAMEAGDIPRRGDGYASVGGAIGIHGTDRPKLNRAGVDWTWGCVSLENSDVERLARLVPIGTLVLIED
jgi:murein L,D-transpeptidase YafK